MWRHSFVIAWSALKKRWSPRPSLVRVLVDGIDRPVETRIEALRAGADDSAAAALAYAKTLGVAGRLGEAADAVTRGRSLFPDDTGLQIEEQSIYRKRWAIVSRAYRLYQDGEFANALVVFDEALKDVGGAVPFEALFTIAAGQGWCRLELHQFAAALADFERAERAQPDAVDGAFGAGLALRALGREKEARLRLARAATRNYAAPGPVSFIGWCHYEHGRFGVAERAFRAALARHPIDAEAQWGLAWTLWRMTRLVEAAGAFVTALERGRHRSIPDLLGVAQTGGVWNDVLAALVKRGLAGGEYLLAEAAARALCVAAPSDGARPMADVFLAQGRPLDVLLPWPGETPEETERLAEPRVRAALAMNDLSVLRTLFERHESLIGAEWRARALEALGESARAAELWRTLDAQGDPDAPTEIDRLRRKSARSSLAHFENDSRSLESGSPAARLAVDLAHARRLGRRGNVEEACRLLESQPDERARALLEELRPTAAPRTWRGMLAAVLSGIDAAEPPVSDPRIADVRRLADRKIDRAAAERWLALHRADPEDALIAEAARRALAFGPAANRGM